MRKILILFFVIVAIGSRAQNLVSNAGFEQSLATGWTIVDGNWDQTSAGYGYGDPNGGVYYATPRFIGGTKEMYQDVDVSGFASSIDNGTAGFSASAYLQVASNGDTAKVIFEYRNTSGNVLASDMVFEEQSNFNVWNLKTANRVAPAGTRAIRIRLLAIPNSGFGDLVMFDDISLTKTTALPLNLLYFKAIAGNDHTVVSWQTANEVNVSSFEVQLSNDGVRFSTARSVNAGRNDHFYTETLPLNTGTVYYRLEMIDRNGRYSYSPIVKVDGAGKNPVSVYPNPASGRVVVSVQQPAQRSTVNIYNSNGSLVFTGVLLNITAKTIDVSALPAGSYQIQLVTSTQKTTRSLVVTH